jgi:hypothetical protein
MRAVRAVGQTRTHLWRRSKLFYLEANVANKLNQWPQAIEDRLRQERDELRDQQHERERLARVAKIRRRLAKRRGLTRREAEKRMYDG